MACDLTKGRLEPCKDGVGGIRKVYFFNFEETAVVLDAEDMITDINDGEETPGSATAFEYDVKGSSSLTQNINASRETGTVYFEQVLNLTLKRLSAEDNKELKLMAYGRPLVVVEDYVGNAYMVGALNGADVTGGTAVSGQAMGDLYGYTLILTGMETTFANFLEGAVPNDPFGAMLTEVTIVKGTEITP